MLARPIDGQMEQEEKSGSDIQAHHGEHGGRHSERERGRESDSIVFPFISVGSIEYRAYTHTVMRTYTQWA